MLPPATVLAKRAFVSGCISLTGSAVMAHLYHLLCCVVLCAVRCDLSVQV
jgi:hypothetical protein